MVLPHLVNEVVGSFSLIASLLIFIMAIGMLKLNRAKAKWRIKLQHAFEGQGTNLFFVAIIIVY
jgi:hypothetical protein